MATQEKCAQVTLNMTYVNKILFLKDKYLE